MSSPFKVVKFTGHVVEVNGGNNFLPIFELLHLIAVVVRVVGWALNLMRLRLILRKIQILILCLVFVQIILLLKGIVIQGLCVEEVARRFRVELGPT